ncbi:hypothetical protein NliqN6_2727 [Naganishia liquefaciens]|uniref:Heme-degrading domain-containing protein n=1 Tax=Naganishia liquefaciens TaxID=104408 RepID=A0A8H3TTE1_9TREE|nr:hypothetical protein NliqN6_2727 [Naganishia liquefaciens]
MSYSFEKKATDFKLNDPALLDLLDAHHARLRFPKFSAHIAFELGLALREEFAARYGDEESGRKAMQGVKEGLGAVMAIKLFDGQQLFACSIGKAGATTADNWTWVNGKEAVVKRTGKASFLMGRLFEIQGRKPEDKGFPFPQYACHGGGYPIWLSSNSTGPIGTILVSGLPQAEDHQLIVDTLVKFLPTLEK